jgi:uncharacterized protein (UPF0276 family)
MEAAPMEVEEFLARLADQADCGLLLDVNNVYVSSRNHDFDPEEYLRSVPTRRIVQFHLAGHTDLGTHCIDTHDGPVIDEVWRLYAIAHELTGGVSTLLEWDARIPSFDEVHREVLRAREFVAGNPMASGGRLSASRGGQPPERSTPATRIPQPAHVVAAEVL